MANNLTTALLRIAELQRDTSPVEVTIGGISNGHTVTHNVLTVRNAPPKVVSALVTEFEHVSLTESGLVILGEWRGV